MSRSTKPAQFPGSELPAWPSRTSPHDQFLVTKKSQMCHGWVAELRSNQDSPLLIRQTARPIHPVALVRRFLALDIPAPTPNAFPVPEARGSRTLRRCEPDLAHIMRTARRVR